MIKNNYNMNLVSGNVEGSGCNNSGSGNNNNGKNITKGYNNYDISEYQEVIDTLRSNFQNYGHTLKYEYRLKQLQNLLRMYEENNAEILNSLKMDMKKSKLEGYLYEIALMENDARGAIKNLKDLMRDKTITKNLLTLNDRAFIFYQPYGVVLICSPWNYPWQLSMVPLCGAIAAGNCVIVKPSEISYYTSLKMAELIPKYLDPQSYRIILGGPSETEYLIKNHQFDYIFYTGSLHVGRMIRENTNKYLTPCTLELGGKSPVYIDETVDFLMASKRILWGKCMNMGQTCVAPDYIVCTNKTVEMNLIKNMYITMKEWYGETNEWKEKPDLARIINERHFNRLVRYINSNQGNIVLGGKYDINDLWIEPTVIGPVLPILTFNTDQEAIQFIVNSCNKARPLCLYVFSELREIQLMFQERTRSGTMAFNDTIIQFAIDELPFGGIGESGMGNYHGKYSFKTFSHKKSIVHRDYSFIGEKLGQFRYPPYTKIKIKFLSSIMRHWKKFKLRFDLLLMLIYFSFFFFAGFFICYFLV